MVLQVHCYYYLFFAFDKKEVPVVNLFLKLILSYAFFLLSLKKISEQVFLRLDVCFHLMLYDMFSLLETLTVVQKNSPS